MTTRTIKCYQNLPVKINCKAKGYWDYNEIKSFDNLTGYNITMKSYDGLFTTILNSNINPKSIDFKTSFLPDYVYVGEETSVLMPYVDSKTYYDTSILSKNIYVDQSGCTITDDNQCILSNSSSYFKCTKPIPSSMTTFKAIFKMTLSDGSYSQVIIQEPDSSNTTAQAYVQSGSYYKGYFNGAIGGVTSLTVGTTYWFGILEDTTNIKGYLLVDDGTYTLDTLPDFDNGWTEEWSQAIASTYGFKGLSGFNLFYNKSSSYSNQYWRGNIDLNNCKVWVDGNAFWYYNMETEKSYDLKGCLYNYTDTGQAATLNCFYYDNNYILTADDNIDNSYYLGTVNIPEHDLYTYSEQITVTYDNFTVNGSPLIYYDTGKVTKFNATQYLDTNYTLSPLAKTPWTMRVKFMFTQGGSTQYIFNASNYQYGPMIGINANNYLTCDLSNGTKLQEIVDDEALVLNSIYRVEWAYDGDSTYTLRKQKASGEQVTITSYDIGSGAWYSSEYAFDTYYVFPGFATRSASYKYSTDGITWNTGTLSTGETYRKNRSSSNGSSIVITSYNKIEYTLDGTNWNNVDVDKKYWGIATDGNKYIVSALDYDTADWTNYTINPVLSISEDNGQTWTKIENLPTLSITGRTEEDINYCGLRAIAYNNNTWVVIPCNLSQGLVSVDNGITWEVFDIPAGATNNYYTCAYGNDIFVAMSNGGTNYIISADGRNWTLINWNYSNYHTVYFDGNNFICVPEGGTKILVSSNGVDWREAPENISSGDYETVVYGNGKYIIGGLSNSNLIVRTGPKFGTYNDGFDGSEWDIIGTYQTDQLIKSTTTMRLGTNTSGSAFMGEIDLSDTYISVADEKIWEATTTHYKGNYTKI